MPPKGQISVAINSDRLLRDPHPGVLEPSRGCFVRDLCVRVPHPTNRAHCCSFILRIHGYRDASNALHRFFDMAFTGEESTSPDPIRSSSHAIHVPIARQEQSGHLHVNPNIFDRNAESDFDRNHKVRGTIVVCPHSSATVGSCKLKRLRLHR